MKRQIIKIDEERCNGCGLCVPSCKEGALRVVDGKAKLVSDIYCDGLGDCLGECPEGAITIEEREAAAFDEAAADERVKELGEEKAPPPLACGCSGSMSRCIERKPTSGGSEEKQQSELAQWPIQLTLVPASAPYLKGANLLVLADCAAVAYADLHKELIRDHAVVMACPKLDDVSGLGYVEKLAEIFRNNVLSSIEVVMMEVPCCGGLGAMVGEAYKISGIDVPLKTKIIGVEGEIKEEY